MRTVVTVATGPYIKGQQRLLAEVVRQDYNYKHWSGSLPGGSPAHKDVPYAFKAFAMKAAAAEQDGENTTLLWCDSCMIPIRSMEPIWEQIESDGYFVMNNGFSNYEWTADSAYKDLFPRLTYDCACRLNREISHVVGGLVGLDLTKDVGQKFLAEWYRLASETKAFCGPWINANAACGPPDVRGHRHDQTALSVIAWSLDCKLTDPPIMSYGRPDDPQDKRTIILADGSYV